MHSLPLFVRLHDRPVILLGTGETAAAKRRVLERAGARVVSEDTPGAALAIVAVEDEVEARAASERLKARGLLVNVVDRPALCDFTLPAIVDRDPVLVAVGTGGASAGLAKAVRQRIEALLPAGLGALATGLRDARAAIRARWPEAGERRRALDAAMASGGALDPLSDGAAARIAHWLDGETHGAAGRLERIVLSSPDPDDLTLRTARLLGEADRIYHDPAVGPAILDRARADAVRIAAASPPVEPGEGLSLWLENAR
jgi:uroporphyrin-III C-methyltransferase/precorrin-2 dehydrogenase/sirohydrochlorin ferrochelatase